METWPTYDTIPEALADLDRLAGSTADGVAKILADLRVRAICGNAWRCAIAEWLLCSVRNAHTGTIYNIQVDPSDVPHGGIVEWDIEGGPFSNDEHAALPVSVNEFAHRFDCNEWPELVFEPPLSAG
jgi:hypothetical protein